MNNQQWLICHKIQPNRTNPILMCMSAKSIQTRLSNYNKVKFLYKNLPQLIPWSWYPGNRSLKPNSSQKFEKRCKDSGRTELKRHWLWLTSPKWIKSTEPPGDEIFKSLWGKNQGVIYHDWVAWGRKYDVVKLQISKEPKNIISLTTLLRSSKRYIYIYIIIIPGEFFTLVLANGISLKSEWQQVSLSLQDSSQYCQILMML